LRCRSIIIAKQICGRLRNAKRLISIFKWEKNVEEVASVY
jgi:hypothetical protein